MLGRLGPVDEATAARRCPKSRRCGKKGERCCKKGELCAGGHCVVSRGTCRFGADTCLAHVNVPCNGTNDCICLRTLEEGITRCGRPDLDGTCGQCTTDDECEATLGKGAFCFRGVGCGCEADQPGFCGIPCPF